MKQPAKVFFVPIIKTEKNDHKNFNSVIKRFHKVYNLIELCCFLNESPESNNKFFLYHNIYFVF